MLSKLKDKASSIAAKTFLQSKLGDAGEIQELDINSRLKKVSLVLNLAGEADGICATVENYSVSHESGGSFIQIEQISSSKRWIEILCAANLIGKKIEVPPIVAKLL